VADARARRSPLTAGSTNPVQAHSRPAAAGGAVWDPSRIVSAQLRSDRPLRRAPLFPFVRCPSSAQAQILLLRQWVRGLLQVRFAVAKTLVQTLWSQESPALPEDVRSAGDDAAAPPPLPTAVLPPALLVVIARYPSRRGSQPRASSSRGSATTP